MANIKKSIELIEAEKKEFTNECAWYVLNRDKPERVKTKKDAVEYLTEFNADGDCENSSWESWYIAGLNSALIMIRNS